MIFRVEIFEANYFRGRKKGSVRMEIIIIKLILVVRNPQSRSEIHFRKTRKKEKKGEEENKRLRKEKQILPKMSRENLHETFQVLQITHKEHQKNELILRHTREGKGKKNQKENKT